MAEDTIVKKRSRSKKVITQESTTPAEPVAVQETTIKKTRTRKVTAKATEPVEADSTSSETVALKQESEKKKSAPSKNASSKPSSSKRVAKNAKEKDIVDVDLESKAASSPSDILREATAFRQQNSSREKEMSTDSQAPSAPIAKSDQTGDIQPPPTKKSSNPIAPNPSPPQTLPRKPSSFLSSFLASPDPTPIPPPQTHQAPPSPKETRASLQQATKHDFEDSILTPQGKVKNTGKGGPATAIDPSTIPAPGLTMSSAQLRAFTTSSFVALKHGSKSTKPGPNNPPSTTTTSPPPSSSRAPPPLPSQSSSPPKPSPPNPKALPSAPTPHIPRPSELPYPELKRHPEYRRLNRRWTTWMVAVPIVFATSYELWRRWERGDLRLGSMTGRAPGGVGGGGGDSGGLESRTSLAVGKMKGVLGAAQGREGAVGLGGSGSGSEINTSGPGVSTITANVHTDTDTKTTTTPSTSISNTATTAPSTSISTSNPQSQCAIFTKTFPTAREGYAQPGTPSTIPSTSISTSTPQSQRAVYTTTFPTAREGYAQPGMTTSPSQASRTDE